MSRPGHRLHRQCCPSGAGHIRARRPGVPRTVPRTGAVARSGRRQAEIARLLPSTPVTCPPGAEHFMSGGARCQRALAAEERKPVVADVTSPLSAACWPTWVAAARPAATVDRDGAPQNNPVGFRYNAELGTIDIGGCNMGAAASSATWPGTRRSRSWSTTSPRSSPGGCGASRSAAGRGAARSGALAPGMSAEIIRVHPERVISFGLESRR